MQKIAFYLLVGILFVLQYCKSSPKENSGKVLDGTELKKNKPTKTVSHDSLITYQGSWLWKSKDSSSTFKLVLVLNSDSLRGKYCAAYDFGNRMDCDFDTAAFNLHETSNQDSILLEFNSFFGAENGIAFIKKQGDSLLWKILKYPQGGDCFAPKYAVMYRRLKGW